LDNDRMSGSLSCIRPAVSINTTSKRCSRAARKLRTLFRIMSSMQLQSIVSGIREIIKWRCCAFELFNLSISCCFETSSVLSL
jgi:hypothetical protein